MADTALEISLAQFLAPIQGVVGRAAAALARACSVNGKIDPYQLDQHQLASYELALIYAELRAAITANEALTEGAPELQQSLCNLYMANAIASIKGRLEPLLSDFGLDQTEFDVVFASDNLRASLRFHAEPARLANIGQAVIDCGGDTGQLVLDEEKLIMQDAFQRIAADVIKPLAEDIHRQDLTVPETILQPLREMGVFGLSVPEKFGGTAPDDQDDHLTMIVVTEALSEASLAVGGSLITRPEILTRALLSGGTEEQKSHWLPQIAAGSKLCGIAITEPDYGSDVAGLSLKAARTEGGWLLHGAKTWCTFAGKAEVLFVIARTELDKSLGHKGLSALLVEKSSTEDHEFTVEQAQGGRLIGKAIPTIGYRGMHSYDLAFEDYFVPDGNLIGGKEGLGKGFYLAMEGLTGGRIQTAARASGVMRAAMGAAARYSQDRRVFGVPLGSYQLTQVKLARMAAQVAACRYFTYSVGRLLDAGQGKMEASLVKLFACRSAEWITREALQIHGGMGYAEETPVSRYFVDARVLSIFEGAEETLALKVIARELLNHALRAATLRENEVQG